MKNIRPKKLLVVCVCVFIMVFALVFANKNKEVISTSTENVQIESLNNTKIEWGIKRGDNHNQPDLGSKNKQLMEQYNGICMGSDKKPYIYLTFDSGYEAGYTEKILEVLKQNNVKATFFITAHYFNTRSDLVKRMIDEGHIVGNQSPHTLMEL